MVTRCFTEQASGLPRECRASRTSRALEDAVYKLSGYAAARFKLTDRGVLRKGSYADVVVFDPETVHDHASFEHPHRLSTGIEHLLVNGVPILAGGRPVTGALPGRFLRFGSA